MMNSVLDLIGSTPLLRLSRVYRGSGSLVAKAEFMNPGGSVKDRAALTVIRRARADGRLHAEQPVVEMTSGNMGAGLAVVCAVLDHPFIAVLSHGNSPERARMLESLGAEVIRIPQVDGTPGRVTGADVRAAAAHARHLAAERGAFYVEQFRNPDCVHAHQTTTGPELWDQSNHRLDGFVACVGSGGTFVGTSRFLKQCDPTVHCAAVEPATSRVLAGAPIEQAQHLLQGTGYGVVPPHWDASVADSLWGVTDAEAIAMRQRLAREEGLHVGYSAAANVHAAICLLESGRLGHEAQVATVLCDTGLKYSA